MFDWTIQGRSRARRPGRAAAALIAAVAGAVPLGAAQAENLTFMGGTTGGAWNALAGGMKSIIEQGVPGTEVAVRPGGGIVNAKALGEGQAEIGWMLATITTDALNGKEPFEQAYANICNLGSINPTVMQIVTVDPDIKTFADVKGKRLSTQPRGTATESLLHNFLGFHDMTTDDLAQYSPLSFTDGATMMKDGLTDAYFATTALPSATFIELFSANPNARVVPLTEEEYAWLHEQNAAWSRATIKAGTYEHQDSDAFTASYPTHLGADCSKMSEETAYQVTKAFIENYKELGSIVAEIGTLAPSDLVVDIGVPMHPGAVRAYKEAGLM